MTNKKCVAFHMPPFYLKIGYVRTELLWRFSYNAVGLRMKRFRVYWQICLPLVKGTLIALGIFTFLGSWNDLLWPLIVLSDCNHLTLPAGLAILG